MSQLKRIRETIDTTLATLGGLRNEVERLEAAFDAITGVVEVTRKIRRGRQRAAKATAKASNGKRGGGITDAILGVLKSTKVALSISDIATALPSLKDKSIYNALTVMVKKRLVKRSGTVGNYHYSTR